LAKAANRSTVKRGAKGLKATRRNSRVR
jgi:hypothetical protein